MSNAEALARSLKKRRRALGLTQSQLGELSGLSRYSIIKIEAAEDNPRLSTLERLASTLGVSLKSLFE